MTFKCRRRANTAIASLNAAMPENTAKPMFLTSCETEMHIKMTESELLCVRVATLLRKQICKHTKSDIIKLSCSQNYQDFFYFIVLDNCLALTTAQATPLPPQKNNNNNRHCSGHNLGGQSEEQTQF